ncbi:heavy metal sensor histidine kinase [Dechloromonas sp. CZR5]|uniref:heavy metal sensor histidine kinase n=1 Tax=Dechloromonas sp. CZR5 TaxID=2608630 RepID=UPI00123D12AA|nr:heavy metal sensor histidine kinase [Dechloromonas sp. CZR5]
MKLGRQNNPTLSARLIRWLASLSLGVLGCLCLGVFFSVKANLETQQDLRLEKFSTAIRHLFEETPAHLRPGTLEHDLEDLLKINRDLHLKLLKQSGEARFVSTPGSWPAQARFYSFELPELARQPDFTVAELALDTAPDEAILDRLAAILWAAALIGSAAITVGGYLIVYLGLSPIRTLAEQTRSLAILSLDKRLETKGIPAELQVLVDQFNDLLNRLEKAYRQLEGFNADVAHELRTPLANIIASSELALRGNDTQENLRDCIGSNLEEMHRLSGIVNDMLFLSQADRGAKARRTPIASLAQLCAEVADYYEAVFMETDLQWSIDGDAAGQFDVALLRRLLSNLLNNAARHAYPGSAIVIRIRPEADGRIELSVINRGEAIPADSLPQIFDRFFRVDTARSQGHQNHGLGLAIVSAIARMHGGEAFAQSARGETRIGVRLA